MIVYFNGDFIPKEEVRISPDDRGFLFADGAYEVIRVYNGVLFLAKNHFERLTRSLQELRLTAYRHDILLKVADRLIRDNNLERHDAAVYIQVTRGSAARQHAFPEKETTQTVYIT
ncbi:aminotransferase class IV, partial [candidate division KSB1 bacterium]